MEVITKRSDAVVYFRKHYGPGVKIEIDGTEEYILVCSAAGRYEIAPDGMSLTVHWDSGGSNKLERIEITEFPDRVEVGVVEKTYNGPNTADLRFEQAPAALSAPLGDRAVIDVGTGKRMRQSGPSPGEPPCPEQTEPTPLEQAIATRQERGLPADPAYVQRRLNSRSYYTRAEQRWLQETETLGDDRRVEAYLRRHSADYSGSTVLATYPAKPTIIYRFVRNAAAHEAAIKRRSRHPEQVRTETVTFTAADIERLEETIRTDAATGEGFFDGYGDAGFSFAGVVLRRASRRRSSCACARRAPTRRPTSPPATGRSSPSKWSATASSASASASSHHGARGCRRTTTRGRRGTRARRRTIRSRSPRSFPRPT